MIRRICVKGVLSEGRILLRKGSNRVQCIDRKI